MPNLDVDSDALRAAGKDISARREALMNENNVQMLDVFSQSHMAISTGGFVPGALAMQRLVELFPKAMTAQQTVMENLIGLASGLHIVADTYDEEDHHQALAFAFQRPDGPDGLAGLPGYVDPETTFEDWLEEDDAEGDENELVEVPEDGRKEYEYIGSPDPTHPSSTTQITHVYDGEDKLIASHYVVRHPDGSTTYYTDLPRDGGTERVNEVTVGPQNSPASSNEAMNQYNDYYDDQREQIQQELNEYGLFDEEENA